MNADRIGALLQRSADNIRAARLLVEQGFDAVAVSRAYCAMFYAAEAVLRSSGRKYSSHGAVISAWGREFAATRLLDCRLHRYLLDAYENRQDADYDELTEVTREDALLRIAHAEEFLTAAREYLEANKGMNQQSP